MYVCMCVWVLLLSHRNPYLCSFYYFYFYFFCSCSVIVVFLCFSQSTCVHTAARHPTPWIWDLGTDKVRAPSLIAPNPSRLFHWMLPTECRRQSWSIIACTKTNHISTNYTPSNHNWSTNQSQASNQLITSKQQSKQATYQPTNDNRSTLRHTHGSYYPRASAQKMVSERLSELDNMHLHASNVLL